MKHSLRRKHLWGKYAEAEKLTQILLKFSAASSGPESAEMALTGYNLGTLLVAEGRKDEGIHLLQQVVDHGLPPSEDLQLEENDELLSLKGDSRFSALVAHAKQVAQSKSANPGRGN
jgi:hypothetical protein